MVELGIAISHKERKVQPFILFSIFSVSFYWFIFAAISDPLCM